MTKKEVNLLFVFRGSGPLMFLVMGIKILIIIAIIVILIKFLKNYTTCTNKALGLLDEKFANGEITEEEYIKRKAILKQK